MQIVKTIGTDFYSFKPWVLQTIKEHLLGWWSFYFFYIFVTSSLTDFLGPYQWIGSKGLIWSEFYNTKWFVWISMLLLSLKLAGMIQLR